VHAIIACLTTRCSSAFALIASCWVVLCAQSPVPRPHPLPSSSSEKKTVMGPVSLFPVRQAWSLAIGSQLTVVPAYDEARVYFSLEGDRIVAYDIVSGHRVWLVTARPQMEPVAGGGPLF